MCKNNLMLCLVVCYLLVCTGIIETSTEGVTIPLGK